MKRFIFAIALGLAGCATPVPPETPPPAPRPVAPAVPAQPPAAPEPTAPPSEPSVVQEPEVTPRLGFKEFVERNDDKLMEVYVGMPKEEVERIMALPEGEKWTSPSKRQKLKTRDGRFYEIWFYLTRLPPKGRAVNENDLTPVILKDEKVAAIGRYQLKKLRRAAAAKE